MDRRMWLQSGLAASATWLAGCAGLQKNSGQEASDAATQPLAEIEARTGGRLGVAVIDTANGRQWQYRGSERFPMCSTFKMLLAAQILQRAQSGQEQLAQRIIYPRSVLVTHSPTTGPQAGGAGLTVAQLCEATVVLSDNTAANLLLARQGGPAGLTQWLRGLGDTHTRLDRTETELNSAFPVMNATPPRPWPWPAAQWPWSKVRTWIAVTGGCGSIGSKQVLRVINACASACRTVG